MDDARREIALRIADADAPDAMDRVRSALAGLDPDAQARIDPRTGIVHITTTREVLDLTAALDRAGLAASAMTG